MLSFDGFTLLVLLFILAPIIGAIALLFLFIFEKRIDLLENKNKKIELEKELQKALYNQLNQQIQPHFLFNTLNVILSLARLQRTSELVRALEVFSLFLKFKYKTNEPLIPLTHEIQYTEHYLEIQKLRFGSRLTVTLQCEQEILDAYIPPFMLQTLVENSFKHGLERKMGNAYLSIRFFSENGLVILQVSDNGTEEAQVPESLEKSGHGLDNIQRRLRLFFDDRASLHILSHEENGTKVEVRWPLVYDPEMKEVSP